VAFAKNQKNQIGQVGHAYNSKSGYRLHARANHLGFCESSFLLMEYQPVEFLLDDVRGGAGEHLRALLPRHVRKLALDPRRPPRHPDVAAPPGWTRAEKASEPGETTCAKGKRTTIGNQPFATRKTAKPQRCANTKTLRLFTHHAKEINRASRVAGTNTRQWHGHCERLNHRHKGNDVRVSGADLGVHLGAALA
jgi:hypothetical protein